MHVLCVLGTGTGIDTSKPARITSTVRTWVASGPETPDSNLKSNANSKYDRGGSGTIGGEDNGN